MVCLTPTRTRQVFQAWPNLGINPCVCVLCAVCCFSVLFIFYTYTSILICGTSYLRSAGYFKIGTLIPLQPTRRVLHSTAIQPSSRVRIYSFYSDNYYSPIHPPLGDIQILFPGIGNFHPPSHSPCTRPTKLFYPS
jgi:hypothetical protein